MKTIKVAKDFSETPGARYRNQGDYSAEEFRDLIICDWESTDLIKIKLDGVCGYASCFIEEVFGGLVRLFGLRKVLCKILFDTADKDLLVEIYDCMRSADKEKMVHFDKYAYHEFLDRCASIGEIFATIVGDHHIPSRHPELRKKIDQIQSELHVLYSMACETSDNVNN